ncbi:DUF192 domain-containing protein [Nocardioides zeae]|uniref:DUF192 domain-containing protein n=1 Tax=Nocardioides imazamoxiresistens TaxID=3231893 RepID=A0ABU3PXN2_9ACTN|nr:DUF192 domain-containing protein [Nocardioides zeae]MDT9593577.1 DUF192 domain-containing protein [Nocardioides zeae]
MRPVRAAAAAAAGVLLLGACGSGSGEPAGTADSDEATEPTVTVGDDLTFTVEVARTDEELSDGLSGREELAGDEGMYFDFGESRAGRVWMVGMEFSIDVAWIADGRVLSVERDLPPCETAAEECEIWSAGADVDGFLEVTAGGLDGVEGGESVTLSE